MQLFYGLEGETFIGLDYDSMTILPSGYLRVILINRYRQRFVLIIVLKMLCDILSLYFNCCVAGW